MLLVKLIAVFVRDHKPSKSDNIYLGVFISWKVKMCKKEKRSFDGSLLES